MEMYGIKKREPLKGSLKCDPDWIQTNDLPAWSGMLYLAD